MKRVRDTDGRTYHLLKRSGDSALVRDVESGVERYLPVAEFHAVDDNSPADDPLAAIPTPVRTLVRATPNEDALELLVILDRQGPLSVRRLLDETICCESDVNGIVTGYRLAGLVEEIDVNGEPGYATTETATQALEIVSTADVTTEE